MTGEGNLLAGIIEFLSDPIYWYALAVVLFFILIFVAGRKPILAALDAEIAAVRAELEQAKKLHAEASATLADYKKRQREALREAEEIIAHAKAEAAQLREQTDVELKRALQRHEEKALQRIRSAEEEAIVEVRAAVIDQAVAAARAALASHLDPAQAERLADQAIAEVPRLLAARK
jgi:F-type H+-transporting ATPase subunit b